MKKLILTLISTMFFATAALPQISTISVDAPAEKPATNNADGRFCFAKVLETNIDFLSNATKFSSQSTDIYKLIVCSKNAYSLGFCFTDLFLETGAVYRAYNTKPQHVTHFTNFRRPHCYRTAHREKL